MIRRPPIATPTDKLFPYAAPFRSYLAERASGVALSTTAGRRHRGSIGGLGADFVALRPAAGAEVVIALRAVSMLRTLPAEDPTVGDRAVTTELTLVEILAGLAEIGRASCRERVWQYV